jgi:hypothetical protein
MKQSDGVANEIVDASNRLGSRSLSEAGGWLVVFRLEGGEFTLQEQVNGMVLAWDDLQTLHSLATCENMQKVSQQLVVGNKLSVFFDCRGKYCKSRQILQFSEYTQNIYVHLL